MPHEGYANPVMNDGPGFHSNMPVNELTERVTRAIEASNISSAPSVVETMDGVTHRTRSAPTKPNGARVLRSPDTDSGNQPTTLVVSGTNMGKHPERQSAALGESTKMLSLQPTHQPDTGSGATPVGALACTRGQNRKFPRRQDEKSPRRFYPNRPGPRGLLSGS